MKRPKVAVLKVRPATILEDIDRLCGLAEVERALDPTSETILKDNISWHFPFPGANTTPWQLEGTILKLRESGYTDQVCVQNNTVVTDPKKGERLNRYLPVLDKYDVRYVVVGPIERADHGDAGLAKWDQLERRVFDRDGTTVWDLR